MMNQSMQCLDNYGIWLLYNETRDKHFQWWD